MAEFLIEADAREVCERVISHSTADAAQVTLVSGLTRFARYARNEMTVLGDASDAEVTVTSTFGQKRAAVTWNDLRDTAVGDAVSRSEQLAQLAPDDPETMPPLGPQEYSPSAAFFDSTNELRDEDLVTAVQAVTERASSTDLLAAGFIQTRARSEALLNTAGLFAYHQSTLASHTTTVRTADGTGSAWAGATHNAWEQMLPAGELAERAIDRARQSVNAVAVDVGAYTVVLEPTAVGNLVQLLHSALGARAADEGRSFFSQEGDGNRVGEQVIDERFSLLSDPTDPDLLARPFAADGTPLRHTRWIENGVLQNLEYDRYWASRQGREPLLRGGGIKLTGGEGTVDDLVSTVNRGLLVPRFWYVRPVDHRRLTYTGLTRDGMFLIEDGRIVRPVSNMWFKESIISILNNVESIGSAVRAVASESGGLGVPAVVPPVVVRDFHFTIGFDAT